MPQPVNGRLHDDQTLDPIRMSDGQHIGDGRAEIVADDIGLWELQMTDPSGQARALRPCSKALRTRVGASVMVSIQSPNYFSMTKRIKKILPIGTTVWPKLE
jgi:hypothetical protein